MIDHQFACTPIEGLGLQYLLLEPYILASLDGCLDGSQSVCTWETSTHLGSELKKKSRVVSIINT